MTPRGTNFQVYDTESEVNRLTVHHLAEVRVDFWSMKPVCFERALCMETFARSEFGVAFFNERGVGLIEASGPTELSVVDESMQYVRLAQTTLTLEFDSAVEFALWGTEGPIAAGVKDVDAFYPKRRQ
jgi:hypothetical protein